MMGKPKIFIAEHCQPCEQIKQLASEGKLDDVEIVDVESEDGFPYIDQLGIDRVPIGYKDGQFCMIEIDEGAQKVRLICDQIPSGPEPE